MSAFNLLLTSNGCTNTYPNNYGGDFKIDMYEELHLQGNWEVALSEMTYYGQDFVNIPNSARSMSMTHILVKEKPRNYVIKWKDSKDFQIRIFKTIIGKGYDDHVYNIDIPQDNYTWEGFIKYVNNAELKCQPGYEHFKDKRIQLFDANKHLNVMKNKAFANEDGKFYVSFSGKLKDGLKLTKY